jgi:peptidoglycan glycosyltransferase
MTPAARIRHLANAMLAAFGLLLAGRLLYWQLVRVRDLPPVVVDPSTGAYEVEAGNFEDLPQPVVQRTVALLAGVRRGTIYDRNGQALAQDAAGASGTVRVYSEPSLAHVVGYASGLRTGVAGIERSFNQQLLGLDRLDSQLAQLTHGPVAGSDVYLTLDGRIQSAAARALGGRTGAVVVLDAHSGAVLAMVSEPGFDPNRANEPGYLGTVAASQSGALLNRATHGLYPPGSTFKTVTLIAALDSGVAQRDTVFDFGEPRTDASGNSYYAYDVGGGTIVDYNHRERQLDLAQSYAASANAAFGRLGDELGGDRLIDYAARLGFSTERGAPPLEIGASPAQLAGDLNAVRADAFLRASTAIGQGELLASPLSMALVVAAVLNDGDAPRPHLVQSVRSPDGWRLQGEPRGNWLTDAMRTDTARAVREMMIGVVTSGSGGAAAVPGLTVGGKTGTAQLGGAAAPHAWFIGFAEDGDHSVVIAVVVENGGSGAHVAAPVFAQVAAAAMQALSQPAGTRPP